MKKFLITIFIFFSLLTAPIAKAAWGGDWGGDLWKLTGNVVSLVNSAWSVLVGDLIATDITTDDLTVTNDAEIQGDLSVDGDATFQNIFVLGQANINQLFASTTAFFQDLFTFGNSTTTRSSNIGEDLTVEGNVHFENDLQVDGSATTTGVLEVGEYTTTTGGVFTQGDIHSGSNLTVDGNSTTTGKLFATDIRGDVQQSTLATLNGPNTLQVRSNIMGSTGSTNNTYITDNSDGTVAVAAGFGFIRDADDHDAMLYSMAWSASSTIGIQLDNPTTTVFIYADYNGGSPIIKIKTSDTWNWHTEFPLGSAVWENAQMHILNNPVQISNFGSHTQERFYETSPFQRADRLGGCILGETGTNDVTITACELYDRIKEFDIPETNTDTGGDTCDAYYRDGGGSWTLTTGNSQWDNLNYDDGTGTLNTLNPNQKASLWFYVDVEDGKCVWVYGRETNATLASALDEPIPNTLPLRLSWGGKRVGRIVFQQNGATALEILSAFDGTEISSGVTNHNDLASLQGGATAEYFHMTSSEYTEVNAWLPNVILLASGGMTVPQATTSNYLMVGSGTVNNLDFSGGDLYVADDVEIDSDLFVGGNVGIGTSTPSELLYITGSSNSRITIDSTATDFSDSGVEFTLDNVRTWLMFNANNGGKGDDWILRNANSDDLLVVEQGGNVGIGIENPDFLLHVRGNNDLLKITSLLDSVQDFTVGYDESRNTWDFNVETGRGIEWQIAGDSKIRISSDGNVGIGITNPSKKFEVVGTASTTQIYVSNDAGIGIGTASPDSNTPFHMIVPAGTGNGMLLEQANATTPEVYYALQSTATGVNAHRWGLNQNNDAVFTYEVQSGQMSSAETIMVLKAELTVGIGTLSPSANLDIVGTDGSPSGTGEKGFEVTSGDGGDGNSGQVGGVGGANSITSGAGGDGTIPSPGGLNGVDGGNAGDTTIETKDGGAGSDQSAGPPRIGGDGGDGGDIFLTLGTGGAGGTGASSNGADGRVGQVIVQGDTDWGTVKVDGANGGCFMMRDTDDSGWTECKALNGTLTCAIDADGICD